MTNQTGVALHRTLLLMRDELRDVSDGALLDALLGTEVVLTADRANLDNHAAQTAYVTAALLMARSGHQVHLVAPDVNLLGQQPPLTGTSMISALLDAGRGLLPGLSFSWGTPKRSVDLKVRLGDTPTTRSARRSLSAYAAAWGGGITAAAPRWRAGDWPFGSLAAAGLIGGEAFKHAMWKLLPYAINPDSLRARFAFCDAACYALAAEDVPQSKSFGTFDVISGGAIANGFLYCVARVLGASGGGRVMDFDVGDLTNMNRNMLLLRSGIAEAKVDWLARHFQGDVRLIPHRVRFDAAFALHADLLAERTIVGVDDIPTRWVAQKACRGWLGIGATSHWSAMASYHDAVAGCARCLHASDDPANGPIPTVAFVSFWAGLLLATYFQLELSSRSDRSAQQTYLTPLRPELPWKTAVPRRANCPLCGARLLT